MHQYTADLANRMVRAGHDVSPVATRHYPCDRYLPPIRMRTYWGIENKLHWVLDLAFREDESRVRKGNGPQNFAVLRHIALNLLKRKDTAKISIRAKRKKAGWDNHYLLKILTG